MSSLLQQLARDGEISWLSYYFAEFVSARDASPMDALPVVAAALVSEANLAGNVCVDLEQYRGRAWFSSNSGEPAQLPSNGTPADWREALLVSRCVGESGQQVPMILDDMRLYLNRYWYYEHRVAEIVSAMLARTPAVANAAAKTDTSSLIPGQADVDRDQLQAVHAVASRAFSVISGGPGSGKTSTVVRILALLLAQDPDYRIALAAPTGKAAARMMDSIRERLDTLDLAPAIKTSIPLEARTLHGLLGYGHQAFAYHAERHLPVDCVVVDEASMIDLKLMYQLLIALPDTAQLILLGDRDQLASVAAGNVLGDITGHGYRIDNVDLPIAAATSLLRSSYRFGHDSAIGELAQRVRQGDADRAIELLRRGASDLQWIDIPPAHGTDDSIDDAALRWVVDAYQPIFACKTPAEALDVYERTRLLCVTNRGPLGIDTLNSRVSAALLAGNQLAETAHFPGLPIMVTRNLHDLGLFNGDTGILWVVDGELRACFRQSDALGDEGAIRSLAINRLSDIQPAWAITVHKSQGSEFEAVLLLLPTDIHSELLSRELLYTGITRARREFRLQASEAALAQAVTRLTRRHSGLAAKLGWPSGDDLATA